MKKLFLSLASVPMFAAFAAVNADEPTPADTSSDEPITLDVATLDDITAAGSSNGGKERWNSGDRNRTFQFNQPVLSPNTNLALQVGVLSHQSSNQSIFQGNISD